MPKIKNISQTGIEEPKFELLQVNSENLKRFHWTCRISTLLLSTNLVPGCFSNIPRVRSYAHCCKITFQAKLLIIYI